MVILINLRTVHVDAHPVPCTQLCRLTPVILVLIHYMEIGNYMRIVSVGFERTPVPQTANRPPKYKIARERSSYRQNLERSQASPPNSWTAVS
jgi:hypothetical protein